MTPHLRGRLQDKIRVCPYCGWEFDTPDRYETTRVEETVDADGTRRRVEVSESRSDLAEDGIDWERAPEWIRKMRKGDLSGLAEMDNPGGPAAFSKDGGQTVVNKKLSANDIREMQAAGDDPFSFLQGEEGKRVRQALQSGGMDPDAMKKAFASFGGKPGKADFFQTNVTTKTSGDPAAAEVLKAMLGGAFPQGLDMAAEPGKRIRRTTRGSSVRPGGDETPGGAVSLVKWLVILGVVILAILLVVGLLF